MQSVTHNASDAMPAPVRIGRAGAARWCRILAWLAFIALPHGVLAQDLSANARLLAAARAGDQAGVGNALADGASANARNRVGETALVIALKNDQPTLAMTMLKAGTDVNLSAVNGVTPLMAAAHAGQTDIVRLLLGKGADVSAADRLQKNAMTYAAGQGRTDIVVLLLRAGVDPNAIYAHQLTALMWAAGYGKTALDIAREGNFVDTVKQLESPVRP